MDQKWLITQNLRKIQGVSKSSNLVNIDSYDYWGKKVERVSNPTSQMVLEGISKAFQSLF